MSVRHIIWRVYCSEQCFTLYSKSIQGFYLITAKCVLRVQRSNHDGNITSLVSTSVSLFFLFHFLSVGSRQSKQIANLFFHDDLRLAETPQLHVEDSPLRGGCETPLVNVPNTRNLSSGECTVRVYAECKFVLSLLIDDSINATIFTEKIILGGQIRLVTHRHRRPHIVGFGSLRRSLHPVT